VSSAGKPALAGQVNGCPFGSFWASKMNVRKKYNISLNENNALLSKTNQHSSVAGYTTELVV